MITHSSTLGQLCLDPDTFFQQKADSERVLGPALVVGSIALLGVFSELYVLYIAVSNLPTGANEGSVVLILLSSIVIPLVSPFVFWVMYSLVFYEISRIFTDQGSFRMVFRAVGWGFFPRTLGTVFIMATTIISTQHTTAPTAVEQVPIFISNITSDHLRVFSEELNTIFLLWSGFIWIFAISNARKVTIFKAGLVIMSPLALSVLWSVYTLG